MRCHYCDARAVLSPEHEGIRVGLCRTHARACVSALEGTPALRRLDERLDREELTDDPQ